MLTVTSAARRARVAAREDGDTVRANTVRGYCEGKRGARIDTTQGRARADSNANPAAAWTHAPSSLAVVVVIALSHRPILTPVSITLLSSPRRSCRPSRHHCPSYPRPRAVVFTPSSSPYPHAPLSLPVISIAPSSLL
ncbi:unnamed protein product [Cyclocybe aegerita]|uniref:Uncharacterized protein n=1 Tax=Cyclocybe aegerita TaxID=1973307 RepID=A0A8S0XXA7_CYCAE|nr:unnamed protein product [Cyclocybe aegerita]